MEEQKFIFELWYAGYSSSGGVGKSCKSQIEATETEAFFEKLKRNIGKKVQLHSYPTEANTEDSSDLGSFGGVTHIYYESLGAFRKRQPNSSREHTLNPQIGSRDLYYIGQREGDNLSFEEFCTLAKTEFSKLGVEVQDISTLPLASPSLSEPVDIRTETETDNIFPKTQKTFTDLVNELEIPNEAITGSELTVGLVLKLAALQKALRDEGDSLENRMVIEKTKTLIESTLQSRAPMESMESSEYHKAITKYQQEVSNLSLSQKVLIATMMFLGALAGFIVGAVIGGVVSAGNPLAILAAGFTTAVIVGTSIGTAAGGGLGLLLSRVGVFKYDPIKASAKEFVESIDNYHSARSNNFS